MPPEPPVGGGRRSLVPQGFEWAAHPCFNEYEPPRFESIESHAPGDDDDASVAASARARDDTRTTTRTTRRCAIRRARYACAIAARSP